MEVAVKMAAAGTHFSKGASSLTLLTRFPLASRLPCPLGNLDNFLGVNERFFLTTLLG